MKRILKKLLETLDNKQILHPHSLAQEARLQSLASMSKAVGPDVFGNYYSTTNPPAHLGERITLAR